MSDKKREPWQEAGWCCRFTQSGVCAANSAEACICQGDHSPDPMLRIISELTRAQNLRNSED